VEAGIERTFCAFIRRRRLVWKRRRRRMLEPREVLPTAFHEIGDGYPLRKIES